MLEDKGVKRSVGEKCCRQRTCTEMLGKRSVVAKFSREVLEKCVGEEFWRGELQRSVGEECWREVLGTSVVEKS